MASSSCGSNTDPWSIKKTLSKADIEHSRLFLSATSVSTYILPLWHIDNLEAINRGVEVSVWDCDTQSEHQVIFRNSSTHGYVFEGYWTTAFVNRKGLKKGNRIGLYWDSSESRFNFCVFD